MTGTNRSRCALALFLGLIPLTARSGPYERFQNSQPIFPIIVRIAPRALDSMLARDVQHSGIVNNVIVGTLASGTSHTQGKLSFQLVENDKDDFLIVQFVGQTHTKSRGKSGPALIDSHSDTRFHCTRRIRFNPEKGFVTEPMEIRSHTTLVYDSVRSAQGGLGSRLVSRIAQRRAADSHEQARREIAAEQRNQLIHEFDKRFNEELASLNRAAATARFVGSLFGSPGPSQFAAIVTPEGLQIGVGVPMQQEQSSLTKLPRSAIDDPPVEFWIHGSLFGNSFLPLAALAVERSAWKSLIRILQWNSSTASDQPNNVWIRVALRNSGRGFPRVTSTTGFDNYVFVSRLLEEIPPEIRTATPRVPAPSTQQVVDLSWLVQLLVSN